MMKKLLLSSIFTIAMLSITGCYEADSAVQSSKASCIGAGKCGTKMKGKCGTGKCGTKIKDKGMKCGTGKCGSKKNATGN